MVICAIFGCSQRSGRDQVSFFRIPCADMKRNYKNSDLLLKRQKLWITRIKRKDLDQAKINNARICSLHFISGKPSSLQDIDNPDWAPSVNLGHGKKGNPTVSVERFQRRLDRQQNQISHAASCSTQESDHDIDLVSEESDREINTDIDPFIPSTSQGKVDAESLTELTCDKIHNYEEMSRDYLCLKEQYYSLLKKGSIDFGKIDINSFKDDEQINFYTGLGNAKTLNLVFCFVSPHAPHTPNNKLTNFQEFFLFLVRLRLNLQTQDLGYRFNVSQETASRIFNKWLEIMYVRLKKIVFWPERHTLIETMPLSFKSSFEGYVAVIIDCFEITINRPSSLKARAATWSNYKQRNTVKYLIGITPQGVISFISEGFAGRCSDKYVTETSGILNSLIPGDVVLADRGFMNLSSVGFFCAKLVLPTSTRGIKQLNPVDIESTRKIASLRIHVERVIGQLRKKFHILKGDLPLELLITSNNDIPAIDKIVHICCSLVNLMPSIVC